MFARLASFLRQILPKPWRPGRALVPVVNLSGIIGVSTPLRPGLMLSGVAPLLDKAFGMRGAKAVALVINSPGGSAVQSHLIFNRVRQLSAEKKLPVFAFVEDVAASGGYMIACAADEIVADISSIVGSIGVVGASFGFVEAMKKLGVERRVYTAGENKVMLDPFQPENPEHVERLKALQAEIHSNFIGLVRTSRGARLTGPEKTLFSGEYWLAGPALQFGLIDRIGDVRTVMREKFGEDVQLPVIAGGRKLLSRLVPGMKLAGFAAGNVDIGMADEIVSTMEARAIWARFGF
jgi:signal peptide peptidase SppA